MASGDSLISWTVHAANTPSSNPATQGVNNDQLIANYDASTDESLYFGAFLPEHYDGNGVTVTVGWTTSTGNSGNVLWAVDFRRMEDNSATNNLAGSWNTVTSTAGGAPSAAGRVVYEDLSVTDAKLDGTQNGEYFQMRMRRDANNAADTMSGDAQLVSVNLVET